MSQQINLFNPVFLKQKKIFSAVNMLDALAVLIVGVAAFYAYASIESLALDRQAVETTRQYNLSKLRLAQAAATFAPKTTDAKLEAEVNNLQAQVAARKSTLESLGVGVAAEDTRYTEYMRALARQSLAGLWLTGFRVARGGAEIEISGGALRPELVPSYLRRLEQERALQGRAFDSLSMTQREVALPAEASRPDGAPVRYTYTEFRLSSSHAGLPADGATATKLVAEVPAAAQQPAPSGGAQSR